MLALLAQLTLTVAGVSEGRAGIGFASHIDPAGTSAHYAHNEAVCAACQARSLHGVARLPHPPVVPVQPRETATVLWLESFADSAVDAHNLSRAPPVLS